ncbi:MAG: hypothetical protein KME37_04260 [Candidatus Thiodiazotropha sp. (ex Codakia orbicularis)]|nr:hypothetical protein [Candidatus Thiodiazotropha sp. (ex Codakia orbicularis)]
MDLVERLHRLSECRRLGLRILKLRRVDFAVIALADTTSVEDVVPNLWYPEGRPSSMLILVHL